MEACILMFTDGVKEEFALVSDNATIDSLCAIDELGNDDGMEGGGIGHSQTSPKEKCN